MKLFSVVIGVITLLIIAGCQGGGGGDSSGSAPSTPFLGGNDGLVIEFLEDFPPEEVTDGGTFPFQAIISLENDGEFDLKRDYVKVELVGILAEEFGVSPSDLRDKRPEDDLSPRIRDAEGNIQEPIITEVTFPNTDSSFNYERSIPGNTPYTFRADVCYKYQTKALSKICVLRDLINVDNDDLCDPSESKTIHSSSSPIQVNAFKQTVSGTDRIRFSFDVIHTGSGEIFKEGDSTSPAADCPKDSREIREKVNKVFVTINTDLPNLKCIGLSGGETSGFITLTGNRRTVMCNQELDPGRNDFEKNVEITLDFNYEDGIEKEVLVKHLLG